MKPRPECPAGLLCRLQRSQPAPDSRTSFGLLVGAVKAPRTVQVPRRSTTHLQFHRKHYRTPAPEQYTLLRTICPYYSLSRRLHLSNEIGALVREKRVTDGPAAPNGEPLSILKLGVDAKNDDICNAGDRLVADLWFRAPMKTVAAFGLASAPKYQ